MAGVTYKPLLPMLEDASKADVDRLIWSRVRRAGVEQCWLWTGTISKNGYGVLKIGGRSVLAHRLCLALSAGERTDLMALHSCDNRQCCNPKHLRWGTSLENLRDAQARGRVNRWRGRRAGAGNPSAKLNPERVAEIRERFVRRKSGISKLAADFGVSPATIHNIVTGKSWKDTPA